MYKKIVISCLTLSLLCSCARKTPIEEDPLEPFNRGVHCFNEVVDTVAIVPVARTYDALVIPPAKNMVNNFFANLNSPRYMVNNLLQANWKQAGVDLTRFGMNSTLGLLGFFDVASEVGLEKKKRDFGQTLGKWGYKRSTYLVLPILGPSSLRDTMGMGTDYWLQPQSYLEDKEESLLYLIHMTHLRASLFDKERILKESALDTYALVRNAYLQHRNYVIKEASGDDTSEKEEGKVSENAQDDEYLGEPPE